MVEPVKYSLTKCKYCERKIVFAVDENGKTIPLDTIAPVYFIRGWEDGKLRVQKKEKDLYGVLHHATCAGVHKANEAKAQKEAEEAEKKDD